MATKEEAEALLAEIIELSKTIPPPMSPIHGPIRLRVKQEVSYKEMEEEEFGDDDDESSEDEKKTEKRPYTPKTKRRVYYREKRGKMRMFCHVCNHPIRRHHKASHLKSIKHQNGVALLVRHGITPQSPTPL